MLELGVEGVKTYIKTIGLYNSKAENIIRTCRILLEQHNGEVPEDRAALEALPGVGRKQPTSYQTLHSAGRLLLSTRTFSAFVIVLNLRREKRRTGRRKATESGSGRV